MRRKKIIVAVSGGVDSAVAALLLKDAGFEVAGVFLKLYNSSKFKKSEKKAKKITETLKIPLVKLDLEKNFKEKIIDYFLKEYEGGGTPNPCVVCNKEIKFEILLRESKKITADYMATGHYARLLKRGGEVHLLRGKDKKKDQSYFLWMLQQKQLKHILFPLGNYTKKRVKKIAKKFELPALDFSESQEICFVQTTVNDFLKTQRVICRP